MERDQAILTVKILAGIHAAIAIITLAAVVLIGALDIIPGMDAIIPAAAGGFVIATVIVYSLFMLYVAWKLMELRNWARIVAIIMGVISLFSFPIGTLLGIANIYFLGFNKDVRAIFKPSVRVQEPVAPEPQKSVSRKAAPKKASKKSVRKASKKAVKRPAKKASK